MNRAHFVSIALLIAAACEGDTKVPGPTTPTGNPEPSLASLVIQGPLTVGPGQTAQVKAVARFADGTERDVTADARWTSSQAAIATVDAGVVMGQALGRAQIRATYVSRSASLSMVIKPEGTFVLAGNITEPGPVNIGMATVAVLGGTLNQVTANSLGFYELFGVAGALSLRVSKPGYLDETRTLSVTQDQTFDVQIKPVSAPASVAGTYRVILTISPSCSIVPDDQKTRTYTATIGQDMAKVTVRLGGAKFVVESGMEKNSFNGTVFGSTVTFDWGQGSFYYYSYNIYHVQEILPDGQILGIWGKLVAQAAQTISGNLVGGFNFSGGNGARNRPCSATDNRVVFTRM